MNIKLRPAKQEDMPEVLALIKELALYERAPGEVTITLEDLIADGFGERPLYEIILAAVDDEIAGMAFFFISYSTWKGKCIYLEDIIVKEKYRGRHIGKALFDAVIVKSGEFGANRLQWQVLNWNEPAIRFYKKYNAGLDETWINGKLTSHQIREFMEKNRY